MTQAYAKPNLFAATARIAVVGLAATYYMIDRHNSIPYNILAFIASVQLGILAIVFIMSKREGKTIPRGNKCMRFIDALVYAYAGMVMVSFGHQMYGLAFMMCPVVSSAIRSYVAQQPKKVPA
jgi:hypothetical protein